MYATGTPVFRSLSRLDCRSAKQGYERRTAGRNSCARREKVSEAHAVENHREHTTTGVVGANRLHNSSRKSRSEFVRLPEWTGENRA